MSVRLRPMVGCVALMVLGLATPGHAAPGSVVPEVKAETLNKAKIMVPKDFTAERNVLLFSFGRDMQATVDAWDAALTTDRNGTAVQVYNMPLIPNPGAIVRGFISGGMRGIYEDKAVRDRVIVLYVDEDKYFPALGVTNKTAPLILVTDKAGVELGRIQSVLNDTALSEVRALIAQ
jgi:hypothetical protein